MLNTVLFDMGGTLEDIWYDEDTAARAVKAALEILSAHGLQADCPQEVFAEKLFGGITRYKQWSEGTELERKPEQIWNDYYLSDFGFDRARLSACAEELAGMWEVTYYHRELRPGVGEMLEALSQAGYKLGVISNTASIYSVFDVLEDYGIRGYFRDVTLSSVTGYRKPHPHIFEISLRQMQSTAAESCYVGDTLSRDIIGAKQAGFGAAVQIKSFLSARKDVGISSELRPDFVLTQMSELAGFLASARV